MGDYASAASEGAQGASEGASAAGTAAQGASEGAQAASLYGQMANLGDTGTAVSSTGSAADGAAASSAALPDYTVQTPTNGPTVASAPAEPSLLQKFDDLYARFEKGQNNSLGKAWESKGANPETFGYLYNKLNGIKSMGGGGQSPQPIPINTTINQAPNSDYERYMAKYGRR